MPEENKTEETMTEEDEKQAPQLMEVGAYAGGGAVAGALISAKVGSVGLATAGTMLTMGVVPIATAGAVVGLAAYGLKKTFFG